MKKFPYRIYLEESPGVYLILKVQGKWPGSGEKIFCISEGTVSKGDLPEEETVDKCPIILVKRYGKN